METYESAIEYLESWASEKYRHKDGGFFYVRGGVCVAVSPEGRAYPATARGDRFHPLDLHDKEGRVRLVVLLS